MLPVLQDLQDCADYSKTVVPYLPQLYQLPQLVFDRINDADALKNLYLETNPLITAFSFALFLTPLVLVVSEVNRNYSQVDRLWSLLPTIYNSHYAIWAHLSGLPTQRLDHVMAVSILWSIRLTYNYWRRGGYSIGSEDYRWEKVKEYCGPFVMFIFNVVFISLAQNVLLFAITTPTYVLLLCSRITGNDMTQYDNILPKLMFGLVILEYFADQQQWDYHAAKAAYQKSAKVPKDGGFTREQLDRGFNTSGLWAWSRHPNFAAEQAIWAILYQWGCCESWTFANWTFLGTLAYLFLFQASTWLTELLSARKYPEYAVYRQRVGRFLPKRNTLPMDKPKAPEPSSRRKEIEAGGQSEADKLRDSSKRG